MKLKTVLLLFCLSATFAINAQENKKPPISIKQRLLQRRPNEMQEKVDSFRTLHLMIAGNVYQTEKHVNYAYDATSDKYDFKSELKYVQPMLNLGDISIVNLNTAFADDPNNIFSSPDEFALAIKYSGINAVMHANQHTANIDKATLKRTRELFNDFDLYHTGAFVDKYERTGNYPLIINKKGFTLAVLNYTYLPARPANSRDFFINEVDKSYIDRDMRMALVNRPDFIIVYFNWGDDAQAFPSATQQELAKYVFAKGANLVVGASPNKPMKLDYFESYAGGKEREGIVAYSLGNLIASNEELKNRNGYIIDMEIKKNNLTGETKIDDWGVIPVYTYYDTSSVKGKTSVYSLPCWAVESGDIFHDMPYIEKRRVANSAYTVREMLGSSADEIQYNLNELIVNNVAEAIHITNASLNNKYSQVRELELKHSLKPVPPTYLEGSKDVMSLAMITQQTQTSPEIETKKPASRQKGKNNNSEWTLSGDELAMLNSVPPPHNDDNSNNGGSVSPKGIDTANNGTQQNISSGGSVVSGLPASSSQTNTQNNSNDATASGNSTGTKNNLLNNSSASRNTANGNANNTDNNSATQKLKETKTGSSTGEITASQSGIAAKGLASDDEADRATISNNPESKEKTAKAKTPVDYDEYGKPKKNPDDDNARSGNRGTGNTGYRTGNDYSLNDPGRATANKMVLTPEEKERMKVEEVNAPVLYSEDISTNIKMLEKLNANTLKGSELGMQVDTFYRIRFYEMEKYLPLDTNYYTHLKGYEVIEDNGLYEYYLGKYRTYDECYRYWKSQIQPRYKQSIIVKYIDRKRILK